MAAAPVAARAATAMFSSNRPARPRWRRRTARPARVPRRCTAASADADTTYGVYECAASTGGFGVYSAGRLGTSRKLICTHCLTGGDINAATFPTISNAGNATKLEGTKRR